MTLNIGATALLRAARIFDWLSARTPHVIVLTETSEGPGTDHIAQGLSAIGYRVWRPASGRDRGVLLASRVPVRRVLHEQLDVSLPWRVSAVVLDTQPAIGVLGIYVPSRDRSELKIARKQEFIASLLESIRSLPARVRRALLLIGDYNVVARTHQPAPRGYFAYEYEMLERLKATGLEAAHDLQPAPDQPHSWIGRSGRGYLYDYAHLGAALHPRLETHAYLHDARTEGLSDHAAVAVRIRLGEPIASNTSVS